MTELLQRAFEKASQLPPDAQDDLAEWVLEEMTSEERWTTSLRTSSSSLSRMAAEAIEEHRQGKTLLLDPERL